MSWFLAPLAVELTAVVHRADDPVNLDDPDAIQVRTELVFGTYQAFMDLLGGNVPTPAPPPRQAAPAVEEPEEERGPENLPPPPAGGGAPARSASGQRGRPAPAPAPEPAPQRPARRPR
jgi:hypothetical protein